MLKAQFGIRLRKDAVILSNLPLTGHTFHGLGGVLRVPVNVEHRNRLKEEQKTKDLFSGAWEE